MNESEEVPNFRKFDPKAALRTTAYAALTAAALLTGSLFGILLLMAIREARRYWVRRRLAPVRAQVQQDYSTASGRTKTLERIGNSALGQVFTFELLALGVTALLMVGWYIWGPRAHFG